METNFGFQPNSMIEKICLWFFENDDDADKDEIAARFMIKTNDANRHLKTLVSRGLIKSVEKAGKELYSASYKLIAMKPGVVSAPPVLSASGAPCESRANWIGKKVPLTQDDIKNAEIETGVLFQFTLSKKSPLYKTIGELLFEKITTMNVGESIVLPANHSAIKRSRIFATKRKSNIKTTVDYKAAEDKMRVWRTA